MLVKTLEIAVIIGAHPALYLAAATKMPDNVDEYEVAGSSMGGSVKLVRGITVDVDLPAEGEYILEGKILAGVREPEWPFGEYTGYATSRSTNNVFSVTGIASRQEPIFLELIPGFSTEHRLFEPGYQGSLIVAETEGTNPWRQGFKFTPGTDVIFTPTFL